MKWLKGARADLPAGSVNAKVLCRRHNQALSKLDAAGTRFFGDLNRALRGDTEQEFYLHNGELLSRWMLKAVCGLWASGQVAEVPKGFEPPEEWLDVLFGDPWPTGWGLYLREPEGTRSSPRGLHFTGVEHVDGKRVGAFVTVSNLEFFLALDDGARWRDESMRLAFQPSLIEVRYGQRRAVLVLSWTDAYDGGFVGFRSHPIPQGNGA